MKAPNSKDWIDLPKPLSCFTVRNAAMINLNNGKVVQLYSANTKIVVVQKYVSTEGTYYRTRTAEHHYLNYAFKASAFGLPDEKAPSVHSSKYNSLDKHHPISKPRTRTHTSAKKQTSSQKVILPNDGEGVRHRNWLSKIFRRKNGKTKNS